MKTKEYRMRLSTFRKLRRIFKPLRNETCADYFERLAEFKKRGRRIEMNEKVCENCGAFMIFKNGVWQCEICGNSL